MKLTSNFEQETKNTVSYAEESDPPIVGVLYVQKLGRKQFTENAAEYPQMLVFSLEIPTS